MLSITLFFLLAFLTLLHAAELAPNNASDLLNSMDKVASKFVDRMVHETHDAMHKMVNKTVSNLSEVLIDRALKLPSRYHLDLDHTTFGKLGHLASSPRTSLRNSFALWTHPQSKPGNSASLWAATGHRFSVPALEIPYSLRLQGDRRQQAVIVCAKGQNSKRKEVEEGQPDAPRITRRVGRVSVKRQIRIANRIKSIIEGDRTASMHTGGTRFRKKKEDVELDRHKRLAKQKSVANYTSSGMGGLEDFTQVNTASILIVDGYNVCGSDHKSILGLEGDFLAGGPEVSQRALINELHRYLPYSKYSLIVCVFDSSAAGHIDHERERSTDDVEVVDAPDADDWIRNEVKALAEEEGSEFIGVDVASNDHAIRASVLIHGAIPISSEYLLKDMVSSIPKNDGDQDVWLDNQYFKTSMPGTQYGGSDGSFAEKLQPGTYQNDASEGEENISEQKFRSPLFLKLQADMARQGLTGTYQNEASGDGENISDEKFNLHARKAGSKSKKSKKSIKGKRKEAKRLAAARRTLLRGEAFDTLPVTQAQ